MSELTFQTRQKNTAEIWPIAKSKEYTHARTKSYERKKEITGEVVKKMKRRKKNRSGKLML